MHDKDHSTEHTRAAAKTGSGPETNHLDARSVVQGHCDSVAKEQGGAGSGVDYDKVIEKTRDAHDGVDADNVHNSDPYGY